MRAMGERVTVESEEDGFSYSTEFSVHHDYVQEIYTPFKYDPATKKGYQTGRNGQRIALTSYAAFGSDLNRAHEVAEHWCQNAQKAYDMVYGK